jgi:hypothetical protein
MMAVVAILGVLGSTTALMLANAVEAYRVSATRAQAHSDLSTAIDRVVREISRIPPYPTVPGAVPWIGTAGTQQLTWYDAAGDAYSLSLSGTALVLAADGGAASDLLTDVSAFTMSYFDEDDAALGTPMSGSPAVDEIRRVMVSLGITRSGLTESLAAKVYIRSCMSGG